MDSGDFQQEQTSREKPVPAESKESKGQREYPDKIATSPVMDPKAMLVSRATLEHLDWMDCREAEAAMDYPVSWEQRETPGCREETETLEHLEETEKTDRQDFQE